MPDESLPFRIVPGPIVPGTSDPGQLELRIGLYSFRAREQRGPAGPDDPTTLASRVEAFSRAWGRPAQRIAGAVAVRMIDDIVPAWLYRLGVGEPDDQDGDDRIATLHRATRLRANYVIATGQPHRQRARPMFMAMGSVERGIDDRLGNAWQAELFAARAAGHQASRPTMHQPVSRLFRQLASWTFVAHDIPSETFGLIEELISSGSELAHHDMPYIDRIELARRIAKVWFDGFRLAMTGRPIKGRFYPDTRPGYA